MLPISITMFATSAIGSRLPDRFPVPAIVQSGLIVTLAGTLVLLATIKPTLSSAGFATGMAVLGVGMGLMVASWATWSSPRSRGRVGARPEGCSTRDNSSARRSGWRSSGPSC